MRGETQKPKAAVRHRRELRHMRQLQTGGADVIRDIQIVRSKGHMVESIQAMSIPRCGKCGRRVEPVRNGEWCDLCLSETGLSSSSPKDPKINQIS